MEKIRESWRCTAEHLSKLPGILHLFTRLRKKKHGILLKYSSKDQEHRCEYKKVANHVIAFRASLPALSRQILELMKTRGEISVKEIEDSTGANRNTIKTHLKKLVEQHYLNPVGKARDESEIETCTRTVFYNGSIDVHQTNALLSQYFLF